MLKYYFLLFSMYTISYHILNCLLLNNILASSSMIISLSIVIYVYITYYTLRHELMVILLLTWVFFIFMFLYSLFFLLQGSLYKHRAHPCLGILWAWADFCHLKELGRVSAKVLVLSEGDQALDSLSGHWRHFCSIASQWDVFFGFVIVMSVYM